MADEGGLRQELRAAWDAEKFGELVWVEHARGGSVGAPDVFVPLGARRGYCPLELKWWKCVDGLIQFTARPAQKRFHLLAGKAGQRTAYLGKLSTGGFVLVPGNRLEQEDRRGRLETQLFARCWVGDLLFMVRSSLFDETFWKGKR